MMNVLVPSKECSSGCESGWTLYLEHSSNTTTSSFSNFHGTSEKIVKFEQQLDDDDEEEEEEDLSMVSDASSGPPHFDHDIDEDEEDQELLWYRQNTMTFSRFPDNEKQCMKSSYVFETQSYNKGSSDDLELDDSASSHVFTSNKKFGGIHHHHHVQDNQSVSFEKFINYSSQAYSTTRLQVGIDGQRSTN